MAFSENCLNCFEHAHVNNLTRMIEFASLAKISRCNFLLILRKEHNFIWSFITGRLRLQHREKRYMNIESFKCKYNENWVLNEIVSLLP